MKRSVHLKVTLPGPQNQAKKEAGPSSSGCSGNARSSELRSPAFCRSLPRGVKARASCKGLKRENYVPFGWFEYNPSSEEKFNPTNAIHLPCALQPQNPPCLEEAPLEGDEPLVDLQGGKNRESTEQKTSFLPKQKEPSLLFCFFTLAVGKRPKSDFFGKVKASQPCRKNKETQPKQTCCFQEQNHLPFRLI